MTCDKLWNKYRSVYYYYCYNDVAAWTRAGFLTSTVGSSSTSLQTSHHYNMHDMFLQLLGDAITTLSLLGSGTLTSVLMASW